MVARMRLAAAAIMAASVLMLGACDAILPAPSSPAAPTEPVTGTPPAADTPSGEATETATPTAGIMVNREATDPVIARFEPGTVIEIRFVQMIDADSGWALGRAGGSEDHVLKTSDGGQSWRDLTPTEHQALRSPPDIVERIFFLDDQRGWVAFMVRDAEPGPIEPHFWRTSDGGRSWERGGKVRPVQIPEADPTLLFSDPSTGWLLTQHFAGMGHHGLTLSRTTDGGKNWERLLGMPESESTCFRTGLAFADRSNGWMTGECPFESGEGALLEISQDGGSTWQALTLPPPSQSPDLFQTAASCSANSPHLFDAGSGALVVSCSEAANSGAQQRSFLYSTASGGAEWQTSVFPGGTLYLLDLAHGWAFSRDLYWTDDGGANWTKLNTVEWDGQFSFVGPDFGWAVARSADETALVRTTDGGRTWELLDPVISP